MDWLNVDEYEERLAERLAQEPLMKTSFRQFIHLVELFRRDLICVKEIK